MAKNVIILVMIFLLGTPVSANPLKESQWYLNHIAAETGWELNSKGEGIVVAVLDMGVDYTHEDLKNNIWKNELEIPDNGIDDDNNGYIDDVIGWDFVEDVNNCDDSVDDCFAQDNDPMDADGHGTEVAGIIAAEDNDIGIVGIAPKAKIMALRVGYLSARGKGKISGPAVAEALAYAIGNGADVISMSFSGPAQRAEDIFEMLYDAGVVLVAGAGNSRALSNMYPAAFPSVLGVGAIDEIGNRATFSNIADNVDIVAPGVNIFTTTLNNEYRAVQGTSFSAPIASAVAAQLRGKYPNRSAAAIYKAIIDNSLPSAFGEGIVSPCYCDETELTADIEVVNEVFEDVPREDRIKVKKKKNVLKVKVPRKAAPYVRNIFWLDKKDGVVGYGKRFNIRNLESGTHEMAALFTGSGRAVVKTIEFIITVP